MFFFCCSFSRSHNLTTFSIFIFLKKNLAFSKKGIGFVTINLWPLQFDKQIFLKNVSVVDGKKFYCSVGYILLLNNSRFYCCVQLLNSKRYCFHQGSYCCAVEAIATTMDIRFTINRKAVNVTVLSTVISSICYNSIVDAVPILQIWIEIID